MTEAPSLGVVVVTHRADALLHDNLTSLAAQTRPPARVVVVVSNTPRAVAHPALERVSALVTVQLGENLGFARAANRGVAALPAESSAVLLLNDDTRLAPDCLAALAGAWGEGPRVYQPLLLLADGSGRVDNLGHGFFPDGAVWARGRNRPLQATLAATRPLGGFSGAAFALPRALWDDLGGFDARFGAFGEDVDLSLRLMRRGVRVQPVPTARVEHHLGASYGRTTPEKLKAIEKNRIRAAVRSLPVSALVTLPAWTGCRYALFAALAARGRGPGAGVPGASQRAALEGVWEGVREAPLWWRERAKERGAWVRGERAMWRALWEGRAVWEDVWSA